MREFKIIGVFLSLVLLNGCMSSPNTLKSLPKCDGYSRRPLNKSMWNWEGKNPSPTPVIISSNNNADTKPSVKESKFEMSLTQKLTDEEIESYKDCGQKA